MTDEIDQNVGNDNGPVHTTCLTIDDLAAALQIDPDELLQQLARRFVEGGVTVADIADRIKRDQNP